MLIYSLLINYILVMILKIILADSNLKKKKYWNQILRGSIIVPIFFFYKLNNNFKNYYCIYLLIWMTLFIVSVLQSIFIEHKQKFYEDIEERREEYLTLSFSLRKTFVILFLYFMIALLFRYDGFEEFGILEDVNFIFFNPILEGISLSIFASCFFLVMQQISIFKNNFLIYQKLMYSLKNIFLIINNMNVDRRLLLSEMHDIQLKRCDFNRSEYLDCQLNYLKDFEDFYTNSIDKNNINFIIESINSKMPDNIEISVEILKILDNMSSQKKHPIKYIIDNY